VAWVNPGASYLASNDKRILFGLSKDMYVDNLIIHWPDGQKESFNNLEVNIFYHIRQGSGISIISH
jgi:ASPIC and UnbV.